MSHQGIPRRTSRPTCRVAVLVIQIVLATGCGGGIASLERRAEALVQRNLAEQAIGLVRSALIRSPQDPRLLALLGRVKLATGDIAGADSAYGQACAFDTTYFKSYVSTFIAQGSNWIGADRWDLADQAFRSALARDASSSNRIAAGIAGAGSRLLPLRPGDADRAFNAAYDYDTTSGPIIARAYLAFAKGQMIDRPRDAADNLERALAWDPGLDGEIGSMVGAAITDSDSLVHVLMPLAGRLEGRGRASFLSQVSGRRHSISLTVAGRDPWTKSQIEVVVGDTIVLDPTGQVRAETNRDGWISDPCGPAGWPSKSMSWWEEDAPAVLAPRFPRMALLARVGDGPPFAVPARRLWVADVSGRLALAINDVPQRASQGSGSFTVRMEAPLSAYRHPDAGAPSKEGK